MNRVILALDNMSKKELIEFLYKYGHNITTIKIGLELYTSYGIALVQQINKEFPQLKIFLDLKLHDIPSTVAKAIRSLQGLKVQYLTIHLSGSHKMISAAMKARAQYISECKIVGVSILTSLTEEEIISTYGTSREILFKHLYSLACTSQIDAVVCSGHELSFAKHIDRTYNFSPKKICPGIRFKGDDGNDQSRVMRPIEAFDEGADLLVIGRSITSSPDRLSSIEQYLK